jgi:hypothetical protein
MAAACQSGVQSVVFSQNTKPMAKLAAKAAKAAGLVW